ncbi:MAG TPA: VIT1/CCC1 transporter family protein [Alphaproteobacteria bacterium]|nr:VIT1/CCC1 transporter family protein [Alphaproteobacteria bacterium]
MPKDDVVRLKNNFQGEVDGAVLYDALADAEPDQRTAGVYRRLAAVERAHAEFWSNQLERRGLKPSAAAPGFRTRLTVWVARQFGPDVVLPILAQNEAHDSGHYDDQPDAVAAGLPRDERGHARIVQAAAAREGGLPGHTLAQLEGRHGGGGGNALRAAVLGANDGLVSNLSLVMGMAGADADGKTILLTGLAGLVAGACSMAMGEWLSVNSAREMAQKQIDQESSELSQTPELEKEELVLIYQAKGLEERQAKSLADKIFSNKGAALDTLVREELGIDPEELGGSAWAAAISSFGLFAFGAIFPVAPFLFLEGPVAVVASIALSGLTLMTIGAVTSLFTGRSFLVSAVRQLLIGYIAAAITFGVGKLIGVSVS